MNYKIKIAELEKRIIDLSYKHKLSHIGSCLTALPIIYEIYSRKEKHERFVLSCGHAGLALYVVLEDFFKVDAEKILIQCGVHPDMLKSFHIDCSTGSLGQGLPIALGMAMANRNEMVYCLISDGEAMEGSIYEAMNVRAKYEVKNLKVYCNYNGWGAYDESPMVNLSDINVWDTSEHWFMKRYGQEAHYKVLTSHDYEKVFL